MMGHGVTYMEQKDFDELVEQVRVLGQSFVHAYREITGEDLDLEGAIRHYPLIAVGLAAGAGAVGGWLLARRGQKQLPPPQTTPTALDFVERLVPEGLEMARELLSESLEEAEAARTWVDEVLEPSIKEGLQTAVENVERTRFGVFLKDSLRRLEGGEDHQLPDPD